MKGPMLNFFKRAASRPGSASSKDKGKMPSLTDVSDPQHAAPMQQATAASVPPPSHIPDIAIPAEMPKVCLEDFDLLKVLGKGGFGKVMLVRKKGTNDIFAMKVLKKEAVIRRNQVAHTKTETQILKQIRHPFLTRMHFGELLCAATAAAPLSSAAAHPSVLTLHTRPVWLSLAAYSNPPLVPSMALRARSLPERGQALHGAQLPTRG